MSLPPLYKYLSVDGARKTLDNRTFRFAEPRSFNDLEDMTAASVFPEDINTALKRLSEGFADVIGKHRNDTPTCDPKTAVTLTQLQALFRARPDQMAAVATEIRNGALAKAFDVPSMRAKTDQFVKETNDFLQNYRVFCVTTNKNSDTMWKRYAEQDKGIVLRIVPNTKKASKFELFRPVVYHKKRPAIFDSTLGFLEQRWFGDQEKFAKDTLKNIIHTKTLQWKEECEYRLAIPLREGEKPYDALNYHPEEITELYLGSAITEEDQNYFIAKAKGHNPDIQVFKMSRGANGNISFTQI